MEGRRELDRDLESYLAARRRKSFDLKGFFRGLMPKPSEKVEMPTQVEVYEEEAPTPTPSPIVEQKQEAGFLARLFAKDVAKKEEEITHAKIEAEEAITDMKEIAKVSLMIIKQLPDETLHTFKQSTEFARLKEILKKHGLIK